MVKIENHLGTVEVSKSFFTSLVGTTAAECFGVAGMAASNLTKSVMGKISKVSSDTKGVKVRVRDGKLFIELHIIVTYGTNITAIVESIIHKVAYTVEDVVGVRVHGVTVYVDGMRTY